MLPSRYDRAISRAETIEKFPDENLKEQRTRTPADLSLGYYLKSGSRPLDNDPRDFLHGHGLDVASRVRYWDVAMNPKGGNIVQGWSDPRAGVIFISEMKKELDTNEDPPRAQISDLFWMGWTQDCVAEGLPPSGLRAIWVDTVLSAETKKVA